MKRKLILTCIFAIALSTNLPSASRAVEKGEFDPSAWNALLTTYVTETGVDYEAWHKAGTKDLDAFLADAGSYDMKSTFGKEPKVGYLINVYNAWVVRQVLEHYPIDSVKDIDGFFDKNLVTVGGEKKSLDALEAQIVQLMPHNPELLILLAPGAKGMPPLHKTAFEAATVREQATMASGQFFGKQSVCEFDEERKVFVVSEALKKSFHVFDDYPGGLTQFVGTYTPLKHILGLVKHSKTAEPTIEFREEDWALNRIPSVEPKDGKP